MSIFFDPLTKKNPLSLCPIRSRSAHEVGILPMSIISLVRAIERNYFIFLTETKFFIDNFTIKFGRQIRNGELGAVQFRSR
jgi:hypothetical protein